MTNPDADKTAEALVDAAGKTGSKPGEPPTRLDPPPAPTKAKNHNIRVSPEVLKAARKDGEDLLRSLRTTPQGLMQTEAENRARTVGPNEVARERRQGWPVRLLKIIRNPLVILLATLSAVSFGTGDARAGTVMAAMVVLSVGLRFLQEARADTAAAKLKAMIHVTTTVIRDGTAREMPLRDLVPGDIIKLSAGDMIPGDARVLSAKDLFVSQGSLTGESFPVEKFHDSETKAVISPIELTNTCFMGTSVESGTATAVVVATVLSYTVSVLLLKRSILTEKVSRRGFHLSREYSVDPLEILFVREVMRTNVVAFPGSSSVAEVAAHLRPDHSPLGQHLYPVLDEEDKLVGVITRKDLRKVVAEKADGSMIAAFARGEPVVASTGEPLRVVVNRMASSGFTRMPVLDAEGKLSGMVSLQDLLSARARNLSEERDRERVIRIRLPFDSLAIPEKKS